MSNLIKGIALEKDTENGVYICYVEDFTDGFKEKIREMLSSIWHGAVSSAENQDIYNYKKTIKNFLNRYSHQSNNTKKGIIGELLTHILIPNYISDFEVISVMKNKEERSIKKGFDVVYYDKSIKNIWYCEVKSGGDVDEIEIDEKNKERLNAAKTGILEMVSSNRTTIWQSVLNDVNLTIFNSGRKIDIAKLLKADYPNVENRNLDRNVILSSVLYKNLDTKISPDNLKTYKLGVDNENIFVGLIVFSIQKSTYKKIEDFLSKESNIENG